MGGGKRAAVMWSRPWSVALFLNSHIHPRLLFQEEFDRASTRLDFGVDLGTARRAWSASTPLAALIAIGPAIPSTMTPPRG